MNPKYDSHGNIKNINVPPYNIIDRDNDTLMVQKAKRRVQKEQFDRENNLSVVTEQGMFGELGLEDPNVVDVSNKRAKY